MTSQQIEYIIALSEEKSFSKAAARLYVTQPALSQFVKNVEEQVGALLFDRSTSPIRLTPAGQAYIEAAKKMQIEERELYQKIADLSDLKSGKFSLGTSSFRASCMLPKSIRAFQKRYPGIEIEIVSDHVSNLKKLLGNGEIDFCIEADNFDESLYRSETIFTETYYLAAPSEHEFNIKYEDYRLTAEDIIKDDVKVYQQKGIDVSCCQDLPFVFLKKGNSLYQTFHQMCADAGFEPKISMYANQIETAFHWAKSDIAFTFIPDTMIRFGNYDVHPVYYKLNSPLATRDIVVATKKNRYITRAMKEYISVLRELIGYGTWNAVQ